MRIRRSAISPVLTLPCSSSSSSCISSSIHSTISSHSASSSTNSTTTSSSPSPSRRCQGLDLLVKAVYHVAGSVIGVPYIQRRVIQRRRPAIRFMKVQEKKDEDEDAVEVNSNSFTNSSSDQQNLVVVKKKKNNKKQQKKRLKATPAKRRSKINCNELNSFVMRT